jgi:DNA-binding HxlR family transcriptional regulator
MKRGDLADEVCSIARPAALLGDSWTFMILRDAFSGIRRFDQFHERLGLSRPLLARRLAALVEAGVLDKHAYADTRRTRDEYRLTAKGLDLFPILLALRSFADKHLSPDGPIVESRHRDCGGAVQLHVTCADCGNELGARDITSAAGPGALAARA